MKLGFKQKFGVLSLIILITFSVSAKEIWVSPQGNDAGSGSKVQPLATIQMALRQARGSGFF